MNLLLVEDSLPTRKLIATLINGGPEKHTVVEAGSAEEALEIIAPGNPRDIEIFLVDLNLPGMDGASLVREIRARCGTASPYHPYIIMVTSEETEETIDRCLESGANDYITKPVNLKVLQVRMRVAGTLAAIGRAAGRSEYLRSLALGALDTAVVAMAVCDVPAGPPAFPVAFANRAMAVQLAVNPEDLAGHSLHEIQMWSPAFTARAHHAVRAGHCLTEPLESTSPMVAAHPLFCSLIPLNVQGGAATHVLVMQAPAA